MDYKIVLMKDAEENFESHNQLTDCILKIERCIKNDARLSIFLYLCLKKDDIYEVVNNLLGFEYTKKNCNAQGSSKYYLFVIALCF